MHVLAHIIFWRVIVLPNSCLQLADPAGNKQLQSAAAPYSYYTALPIQNLAGTKVTMAANSTLICIQQCPLPVQQQ